MLPAKAGRRSRFCLCLANEISQKGSDATTSRNGTVPSRNGKRQGLLPFRRRCGTSFRHVLPGVFRQDCLPDPAPPTVHGSARVRKADGAGALHGSRPGKVVRATPSKPASADIPLPPRRPDGNRGYPAHKPAAVPVSFPLESKCGQPDKSSQALTVPVRFPLKGRAAMSAPPLFPLRERASSGRPLPARAVASARAGSHEGRPFSARVQ